MTEWQSDSERQNGDGREPDQEAIFGPTGRHLKPQLRLGTEIDSSPRDECEIRFFATVRRAEIRAKFAPYVQASFKRLETWYEQRGKRQMPQGAHIRIALRDVREFVSNDQNQFIVGECIHKTA